MPRLAGLLPGFDAPDALLTAPETRSSSPCASCAARTARASSGACIPAARVRLRRRHSLPLAVDGMRCAEAVLPRMEDKDMKQEFSNQTARRSDVGVRPLGKAGMAAGAWPGEPSPAAA